MISSVILTQYQHVTDVTAITVLCSHSDDMITHNII